MIENAPGIAAVILADPRAGPLGLPATCDAPFAGTTVLGAVLRRLSRCRRVDVIVIAHPRGETPTVPDADHLGKPVTLHPVDGPLFAPGHARWAAARKWHPTGWRGGPGGATCYDECWSAGVMAAAARSAGAAAALIVGPDWPLVDPELCDAVIDRHLHAPQGLRFAFTQAPPGLCGAVVDGGLLDDLAEKGLSFASLLAYRIDLPQGDPIGKDLCVQIDPAVRNAMLRVVYDAPRWRRLLDAAADERGEAVLDLDAGEVVRLLLDKQAERPAALPQHATVELTPRRPATGPITPQHHVEIDRRPMDVDAAIELLRQLAAEPDATITLGGLGDALEHPGWRRIVDAAHQAGAWSIHLETDLLVEAHVLESLLAAPVDLVSVRINADTAATYKRLMGRDGFKQVLGNIEWLLKQRGRASRPGLPWIVPRLAKTADNVDELESFYDRWTHFCGHAVIEAPTPGCGLAPDLAVMDMSPPRRRPCRQINRRLTVLSDGRVAQCDQDWLGREAREAGPTEAWRALGELRDAHAAERFDRSPLCAVCREWHRP